MAQCSQTIEPAIVEINLQGDELTLSFPLQQGGELSMIWKKMGLG